MSEKTYPDYVKPLADGSLQVTLSRPAQVAGAAIGYLTMREPLVRDQLTAVATKGSPEAREIAMMANLCGVAPADIEALPLRDYGRMQVAAGFFQD